MTTAMKINASCAAICRDHTQEQGETHVTVGELGNPIRGACEQQTRQTHIENLHERPARDVKRRKGESEAIAHHSPGQM